MKNLIKKIVKAVKMTIVILEGIPFLPKWVARYVIPILTALAAVGGVVLLFL